VLDVVREAAIAGICFNKHTIEELAELMGVDPTTVARWWRIFRNKAGALMMALVRELAESPQLSDWVSGSIRTVHDEGKKILELVGRCRATFYPGFTFCGFAWVNVLDPHLLFERKNCDKLSGAVSTG
jgi:transcriptional regulator with XRE-family HTH domain